MCDDDLCPICACPFAGEDMCATDIDLGTCRAECLDGAPIVNLETGEDMPDGKVFTYRYDSLSSPGQAPEGGR